MRKFLAAICSATCLVGSALAQDSKITELDYNSKTGGAGGLEIGVQHLDLSPIEKIVKEDLPGLKFDLSNETFTSFGAFGYAGQRRDGGRIGLAGWVAYKPFQSERYNNPLDTVDEDSISVLHIAVFHGGLLAEKSILITDNFSIYAGGLLGGSVYAVAKEGRLAESAFQSHKDYDDEDSVNAEEWEAAVAPAWAFDVHGGATYSFARWLHVGLDASVLFCYSSSGFDYRYGSFWTVNPGVKLRLTIGNSV